MSIKRFYVLIMLAIASICFSVSYAKESQKEDYVTLKISSVPTSATVAIDHVIRGNTPLEVEVTKGEHLLRISIDANWKPYIKEINVKEDMEISVKLTPASQFLYKKAKKLFYEGDYPKAKRLFEKSLKSTGKIVPEAYFYMGIIDYKSGNWNSMEKNLKKYIELNPPEGEFVMNIPDIYEEAINYAYFVSYYLLGEYYKKSYRWGESATAFKLAIPHRSRFIDKNIEATYYNIRKLRKKLKKDPQNYSLAIQLAYLFELKGNLFQAMMNYRQGAKELFFQSPTFVEKMSMFLEE